MKPETNRAPVASLLASLVLLITALPAAAQAPAPVSAAPKRDVCSPTFANGNLAASVYLYETSLRQVAQLCLYEPDAKLPVVTPSLCRNSFSGIVSAHPASTASKKGPSTCQAVDTVTQSTGGTLKQINLLQMQVSGELEPVPAFENPMKALLNPAFDEYYLVSVNSSHPLQGAALPRFNLSGIGSYALLPIVAAADVYQKPKGSNKAPDLVNGPACLYFPTPNSSSGVWASHNLQNHRFAPCAKSAGAQPASSYQTIAKNHRNLGREFEGKVKKAEIKEEKTRR